MSKNIDQVYVANPITTNQATDLMYFGRSPYNATDDTAMLYSSFIAQFPGAQWVMVSGSTQAMSANIGYIANDSTLVTLTLPTTAAQGTTIEVAGNGLGGWLIAQNAGQQINYGVDSTTSGTGGSLASTQRYNAIRLLCVSANTKWNVLSSQGNITVV